MKEYICKEDLEYFLKDKYGDEVFTSQDFDCMFKEIQEFNAVTKADICREFAYRLSSRIVYNVGSGKAITYADAINNAIDSLLAEMEQGE